MNVEELPDRLLELPRQASVANQRSTWFNHDAEVGVK